MAKRLKFDESGDSDDLQSLFDSIADGAPPAPAAPPPRLEVVSPASSAGGDDDELQALFDSVASEYSSEGTTVEAEERPTVAISLQPDRRDDPAAP
jgi:chemotaxis protein CheZ